MDYTFLANLHQEITLPEKGILSYVVHKDDRSTSPSSGFRQAKNSPRIQLPRQLSSIFWKEKPKSNWARTRSTPNPARLFACPRCCHTASRQNLPSKCCSFR